MNLIMKVLCVLETMFAGYTCGSVVDIGLKEGPFAYPKQVYSFKIKKTNTEEVFTKCKLLCVSYLTKENRNSNCSHPKKVSRLQNLKSA